MQTYYTPEGAISINFNNLDDNNSGLVPSCLLSLSALSDNHLLEIRLFL